MDGELSVLDYALGRLLRVQLAEVTAPQASARRQPARSCTACEARPRRCSPSLPGPARKPRPARALPTTPACAGCCR
ncbi:MAG: hypothetical protein MZU91_01230 [Desulfosudis oleivorans]|nr:hypothetical protein [Desulfosudis oleivorans]